LVLVVLLVLSILLLALLMLMAVMAALQYSLRLLPQVELVVVDMQEQESLVDLAAVEEERVVEDRFV
jgi:uncharacterized protein YccT (UPF0319 family)